MALLCLYLEGPGMKSFPHVYWPGAALCQLINMQFGSLKQEKAAELVQGQINPPYLSQCAFM